MFGVKLNNFKITCRCGHYITKNDDLFLLSFYKVRKPTQARTSRNERIIDEVFYSYVCPKCDRDVIVIKRKAINAVGNVKVLIPEKIIGERATEYLEKTKFNRINKTNELTYTNTGKFVKGISMSYFKTINKTHQRPRYLNESGYSGDKVECELKVYK